MPAEVKRAIRVAERVKQELSLVLSRDMRDPRVTGVIVSRVEMPDDLRSARVYVRLLPTAHGGSDAEEENRRTEAVEGLTRATSLLRREVTRRVGLKFAPALKFFYDDGQDEVSKIERLLAEVEAERRKS